MKPLLFSNCFLKSLGSGNILKEYFRVWSFFTGSCRTWHFQQLSCLLCFVTWSEEWPINLLLNQYLFIYVVLSPLDSIHSSNINNFLKHKDRLALMSCRSSNIISDWQEWQVIEQMNAVDEQFVLFLEIQCAGIGSAGVCWVGYVLWGW